MRRSRFNARWILDAAMLVGLVLFVAVFLVAARDFGLRPAFVLSLLLIPFVVVETRLRARWPAVARRELVWLVILFGASSAGVAVLAGSWYAAGMDRHHAENLKWAELERLIRREPAFGDVKIHLGMKGHTYWAAGTVASKADLGRLRSLAARCGIKRLEGPSEDDVSLTVESP